MPNENCEYCGGTGVIDHDTFDNERHGQRSEKCNCSFDPDDYPDNYGNFDLGGES